MNKWFDIFKQSLLLSLAELRSAKLRAFLSLVGITIGILCIVSVRTAVNSLEMNIQNSFNTLGLDILYVQKWPLIWADERDYPWWKYVNRPIVTKRELEELQKNLKLADASCLMVFDYGENVIAGDRVAEKVTVAGVSYDYNRVKEMEFTAGRYFTPAESNSGYAVALLGANVAETLFSGRSNIEGEEVKVNGVRLKVAGVLKKEGDDLFGFTLDNNIIVPYAFLSSLINVNGFDRDPLIAVVPKPGIPIEELKYEIKGMMRSARRLSPDEEDNFAVNQITVVTEGIKSIFSVVDVAGIMIGLLSIVVGAFGIANIMFVAVKERTYIIGIKKAIGAQKAYILLEFLLESVVLCLIGGVMGLLMVIGLFQLLQYFVTYVWESDFVFHITFFNIALGVSISVFVGVIAGFVPALFAANMKPVDAMRST